MEKTIFQSIIDRDIPADIVFETEHVLAFLDIQPTTKGHTLVIPKQPTKDIFSLTDAAAPHLMRAITTVARAVQKATAAPGINIIANNGAAAGQVIFHLHFHLIPRFDRKEFQPLPHTSYRNDEERLSYASAIRDAC